MLEAETVASGEEGGGTMDLSVGKTFDEPIVLFPDGEDPEQFWGKCYGIFQVPILDDSIAKYCFKIIGRRATFCTVQDCTISHKGGGAIMSVSAGDLFVSKKMAGLAFVKQTHGGGSPHSQFSG